MSRGEGFDVMDWSTSWHDDPKWKIIWRRRPDLVAPCAYVYQVLAAESWREGNRLTVQDAWPPLITYDADVVAELMHAKLIERSGKVIASTWRSWFDVAKERRDLARQRNRRANDNRRRAADTAHGQRGDSAVTSALPTVPTVPSVPTDPTDDGREDLDAFLAVRFRPPTPAQRTFLDTYCRVFDLTGPSRAARLILSHPDDPIGALKDDLATWRAARAAAARDAEEPKPTRRRRSSGFTGVNAELHKILSQQYAADELAMAHRTGGHADPNAACPDCQAVAS